MGFFSKKEDRIYSLHEAMKLLKTEKYEYYTTIPVGNGYKIVPEERIKKQVELIKKGKEENSQRINFLNEISEGGSYSNINMRASYDRTNEFNRASKQNQIIQGR